MEGGRKMGFSLIVSGQKWMDGKNTQNQNWEENFVTSFYDVGWRGHEKSQLHEGEN